MTITDTEEKPPIVRAGKVRDRETGRLAYVLTIAEEQE